MTISNEHILKGITVILLLFTLFTPLQSYYNAYVHIGLLVICFLLSYDLQNKTSPFVFSSAFICIFFILFSFLKDENGFSENFGLFLHYITWPAVFVMLVSIASKQYIRKLLYFILVICFIGNVLSLIQLSINPEISRLLAGIYLGEEKDVYYKLGVGGYGYVFAMAFLTYGIVRWLMTSSIRSEKWFLIAFLIVNSLFILYASYTTAILIMVLLAALALLSNTQKNVKLIFLIFAFVVFFLFSEQILKFGYDFANDLGLDWVAKRFEQLMYANSTDNFSSLRRVKLYKESIQTFLQNPLIGGTEYGGHSQIFDNFARYGIWGAGLPLFFYMCMSLCNKMLNRKVLTVFFAVFIFFSCIDTCDVMQLPVVIFFAVPLIFHLETEEAQA